MGAWGVGLFQNDVADDVRNEYKDSLKMGKSDEQALRDILNDNSDYINDDEDKYDFWFGLASVMYDLGRLTDEVRVKALALISDGGNDIERWELPTEQKKRKLQQEKLREKLLSPQPERKKVALVKRFSCPWKVNDVFVYRPQNFDKYILIAVEKFLPCDAVIKGLGDMLPVTFMKLSEVFPVSLEDVDNAMFLPHYAHRNEKPEYRTMWFRDGFRKAAAKFEYAGNFTFTRPELIDYPQDEGLCYCEAWCRLDICIDDGIRYNKEIVTK